MYSRRTISASHKTWPTRRSHCADKPTLGLLYQFVARQYVCASKILQYWGRREYLLQGHSRRMIRYLRNRSRSLIRARLRALDLDPAGDFESIDFRRQAAAVRTISKAGELHKAADRHHCMQYIAVSLLKGEIMEVADYRTRASGRPAKTWRC